MRGNPMDGELDDLLERLGRLEEEFEQKIDAKRAAFRYRLQKGRIVFENSVLAEHREIRIGILRFLRGETVGGLIVSPFIYVLVVPFLLLDLGVWLFQKVCFPIWGIAPVCRADFVVIDRRHLAYLNGIEKLNCLYCGYANGLIAYVQEIAARTEQYWCPIKHAIRAKGRHRRYRRFLDYGDAEGFRARLEDFREQVRRN
tara:strand:+ start:17 stop:616 length:600 start_codon:yes stop_codon:yes gene_type:complete